MGPFSRFGACMELALLRLMRAKNKERLLGEIFLSLQWIDQESLSDALSLQDELRKEAGADLKLGELLLYAHLVTLDQVEQVLRLQESPRFN